jgi:adenylate cyclase
MVLGVWANILLMGMKEFLADIDGSVAAVLGSNFDVEVVSTQYVPKFSDSNLTYDNLDARTKKCKLLESCVLYIDIRDSAALSTEKRPRTLAKLYSAFVGSMVRAAKYHGGHVRNIIGDRVMVVFDQENCFTNAVNTAILMNTISQHIINKRYSDSFKCGIGIDHGKMLVTKAGQIRKGEETEFYRSLLWLGQPANVASRLTDIANKVFNKTKPIVRVGLHYPLTDIWVWLDQSPAQFLNDLTETYSPVLRHKDEYFNAFYQSEQTTPLSYPPILMTAAVFSGYKVENPDERGLKENWWTKQSASIKEYQGDIYGGDVYFTAAKEIR